MSQVKKEVEFFETVFTAVEAALTEWGGAGNLQFSALLTMVATNMKLDSETAGSIDPFIRHYIRRHDKYCSTRGAKGGVTLRSTYEKRQADKAALEQAKQEVKAQIDAKVAGQVNV